MGRPKVKVLQAETYRLATEAEVQTKKLHLAEAKKINSSFMPDKLANDSFYVRNYPIPKGKELFPLEWRMQYAELCYPYAENGPLYIDIPVTEYDIALCERKYETLKGRGVRYVFIKKDADENELRALLEGLK